MTLRVPPLSGQDDVLHIFRSILNKAHDNIAISGLDQSSFSYDVPDGGLAPVSGYLHSARVAIHHTAVRTWIYDDRIQGEIKWTCDWQQHAHIAELRLAAACAHRGHLGGRQRRRQTARGLGGRQLGSRQPRGTPQEDACARRRRDTCRRRIRCRRLARGGGRARQAPQVAG